MKQNIKKQDTVFLLTLVDFLIQVIFFGMFAFVAYTVSKDPRVEQLGAMVKDKFAGVSDTDIERALDAARSVDPRELADGRKAKEDLDKLQKQLGVSNITELTDLLTKMAPVKDLRTSSELIKKAGGIERVQAAVEYYNSKGPGKPHCLTRPGTSSAMPIATLVGYEDHIEVASSTPQFMAVLQKLDYSLAAVRSLPLREFSRVFSKLGTVYPDCKYTFVLLEKTRYVEPRDAANAMGNVYVWARKG
ncbi:hypothetical protein [Cupriavidus oxalaticus]|uniref:Uncharacterized protein n=1 Tax=Cupriavidus oxalaticus TaxID=96344 RepID=A0A5P3VCP9_9BURK|nr:hypothetical protein [Cupriavidus oxalaticus]QEZ44156.1 hypothetical protein D2917_07875 [Cupriavidus oxalaticus]